MPSDLEYHRLLSLPDLLNKKSFFLFGPRSTGKTSLVKEQLADTCCFIDLLSSHYFLPLAANPAMLEGIIKESGKQLAVIDEVQKLPALLDEVHRLIESREWRFLLTGSSARSLKRGNANMLGGRAWETHLYPLVSAEIPDFDLQRYLLIGGLPHIYPAQEPLEELAAYTTLYLREEILAEGVTRDLPRFSRLLKTAALSNAQIINFTKLAADIGIAPSTAIEHFRVLEDTLVGFFLEPWGRSKKRKEIARAKFYLFDVGVTHMLAETRALDRNSDLYGRAFEHFIALELRAALGYQRVPSPLSFWHTRDQREVDFVVDDLLAVEVKAANKVSRDAGKHLIELNAEKKIRNRVVVSFDPLAHEEGGIRYLPWQSFLTELWAGAFW